MQRENVETKDKWVTCPEGHRMHVSFIANTPERLQQIPCPRCGTPTEVTVGQLLDYRIKAAS